jgi:hypothetical protein
LFSADQAGGEPELFSPDRREGSMRPLYVGIAAAIAISTATDLANAQPARGRAVIQATSLDGLRVSRQRVRVASADFVQRRGRCDSILCPGFMVLGVGF